MIPGIVSNCWKTQLDAGTSLVELIRMAHERGFHAVELRQGALGDFEFLDDGRPMPDVAALVRLPTEFPDIGFNLAIAVPYLQPEFDPRDSLFQTGLAAARSLAGSSPAHLRLVDLSMLSAKQADEPTLPEWNNSAARLADLARIAVDNDVLLSVENALQPWDWFAAVFQQARGLLSHQADSLRLCFDACNLLLPGDNVDPTAVFSEIATDELAMVHFKQSSNGRVLDTVTVGTIDWSAQCRMIAEKAYAGPGLFEIAPSEEIWSKLQASRSFLQDCGADLG